MAMGLVKKIFRNGVAIVLGSGIDALFGLLISILLAKYYGQSDFGKISFLGIFLFLLGTIDSLWLRPLLIREIAKGEKRAEICVGNGLIIRGVLSVIALILFWITIYFVGLPQEIVWLALLSSLNMILSPFIFSAELVFRSYLSMVSLVWIKLVSNVLTVVLISAVIFFKGNITHFFIVSIVSSLFLCWISRYYAGQILRPCFTIDWDIWRSVFVKGWFLGLSALFIFIYHRVDQAMLFHMQGAGSTGMYAAGVRLVEWLQIVPLALMSSLLPLMSASAVTAPELFIRAYRLSFKYLLMFIIPIAVGAAIFSKTIITGVYGQQYVLAAGSFSILVFAEIFVFLGIVNNTILVAANKQALDPVFTGASVLVNIIFNMILIPKYGLTGAATASLLAYATGPVMGLFIPATRVYSASMAYYALKPGCAALAMFIVNVLFHFSLPVALILSSVVYVAVLVLLNFFEKDEVRLLKSVLPLS